MKLSVQRREFVAAVLGLMLLAQGKADACGIDWSEPRSHFDWVDFQGHVHLIETLGNLDAGKGFMVPIYAVFNSSYGRSPYLGSGWELPFLESRIEQVDENTFLLRTPSGWLWPFVRTKHENILDGTAGWKAEINGETITAWAACGSKMVFNRGKLISITVKDKRLYLVHSGNRVTEIRDGNKPVLRVNSDPHTGKVTGLTLGLNQTINFDWGQMPRVRTFSGRNFVVGMDKTVTKMRLSDGSVKSFEFGVDEQVQPTLKPDDAQELSWNPVSLLVSRVGEWTYEIKPREGRFANAAISRSNGKTSDFWLRDGLNGQDIVVELDGTRKITTWFTSGALAGKFRSITTYNSSGTLISRKSYSYDAAGALLRISESGKEDTNSTVRWAAVNSDANSNHQYVIRNGWRFTIYSPDSAQFANLTATVNALVKDKVHLNHDDIAEIHVADLPSGNTAYRLFSRRKTLLCSCVNDTLYWPKNIR